ncbi:hypothetical protein EW145_g4598 [Phellinidium pouzarii]|uniref:Multifunctional fusion protein n=1 Tax=Phellinidium pouzarii TaxID=167371 RepID=A0A4S4L2V9_9AGAM|nr:hypothetical protein EW145_g4598 [Phellinidium pouzarii]
MSTPQLAMFKAPVVENEPMASVETITSCIHTILTQAQHRGITPLGAAFRSAMYNQRKGLKPVQVKTGKLAKQPIPAEHAQHLCVYHEADPATVAAAIDGALAAHANWEALPWADRAAIFLKAADLVSGKYRYQLMAATMLGQGKNAWQAEIDAAAELSDFFRFGVKFVEELYQQQPPRNSKGAWNRVEYRPLEGFVLAVSPFNFTAIGGNLCGAPAMVGNVVVWKPSPAATYANYLTYQLLAEAGVPPGVIQFVPGPPPEVVQQCIGHPAFAALHFTGSTHVFRSLWKNIAANLDNYKGYPRIVGETGGKNFHVVHESAELTNAVMQTVRGAYEYQGQKCSALSRLYVSSSLWANGFKDKLLQEVSKIKVGPAHDFSNFMGPVIGRPAFDKVTGYIKKARDSGSEIIFGGDADDSVGYFIQPTIILSKDPKSVTFIEEIFGPVLSVYVFDDAEFDATLDLVDSTSSYGLTGSIFASDRHALVRASDRLRHAAGNVYYNEKCTGAVVGQQPFGGARASGTNDKAGSVSIFYRFVSARSIKENFIGLESSAYPSNFI